MWITNSVAVQGREHITEQTPCQDKVYTLEKDDISVIALADGAGSCPLSHFGAEVSCRTVAEFFIAHGREMYEADKLDDFKLMLYRTLLTALEEEAQKHQCSSVKALSSTLLCAGIYKDKLFTVHIGDGVIAGRTAETLITLSDPDNGEYANQTTFVTSGNAFEHMRMLCTELSPETDAVFLMSDGSSASLYNIQEKRPSKSLNLFADMSKQYSQEIISEELYDFFQESIRKRTLDDCSMCMLVKVPDAEKQQDKSTDGLRPNLIKIVIYVQENGSVSIHKLACALYRKKHLDKVKRDVRQLSEKGYFKYEQGKIFPL